MEDVGGLSLRGHRRAIRAPARANRVWHRERRSCDSDAARSWIRLRRYHCDVEPLHGHNQQPARRTSPKRPPMQRQRARYGWPGAMGKRHLLGRVSRHDHRLAKSLKALVDPYPLSRQREAGTRELDQPAAARSRISGAGTAWERSASRRDHVISSKNEENGGENLDPFSVSHGLCEWLRQSRHRVRCASGSHPRQHSHRYRK